MSRREKRNRAYYLYEDQIEELDELSGQNPSQFLRQLLDKLLGGESEQRGTLREHPEAY